MKTFDEWFNSEYSRASDTDINDVKFALERAWKAAEAQERERCATVAESAVVRNPINSLLQLRNSIATMIAVNIRKGDEDERLDQEPKVQD